MNRSLLRPLFLVLAIVGIALPYAAFLPFILEYGLNAPLFIQEAVANRIATFAWLDVIISAIVLLAAAFTGKLITVKQAVVVTIATCFAGVSAGLPLFFYFLLGRVEN